MPNEVFQRTGAGFSGLASFPTSNIEGLEPSLLSSTAYINTGTWNGILVATEAFGNNHSLSFPGTQGYSLVHEAGHYLGLFHVWGIANKCLSDDYCEDTYRQLSPTDFNAPCNITKSCGSRDMSENYMDYSSDLCMLLFTKCQAMRMRQVLFYSTDRFSLWQSADPITPPTIYAVDAGIITRPKDLKPPCGAQIQGRLSIGNYGTDPISSLRIAFLLNEETVSETSYNLSLPPMSSSDRPWAEINYGPINIDTYGMHNLEARIVSVNETRDLNPKNDTLKSEILHAALIHSTPLIESFQTTPKWYLSSKQQPLIELAPTSSDASDRSLIFKLSGSPAATQQNNYIIQSPILDLSNYSSEAQLTLSLRYSHQVDPSRTLNTFMIGTRSGENNCLSDAYQVIYLRQGLDLHSGGIERKPSEPPRYTDDWQQIRMPLPTSLPFLQLMISVTNGQGGHIYLDDLSIDHLSIDNVAQHPLRLTQITYPSLACGSRQLLLTSFSNYTADPLDLNQVWIRVKYNTSGIGHWLQMQNGHIDAWHTERALLSLSTEHLRGLAQISVDLAYSATRPPDDFVPIPSNQQTGSFFVSPSQARPPLQEAADNPNKFNGWQPATSTDPNKDWQYFRSSSGMHFQAPLFDKGIDASPSFFRLFGPSCRSKWLS